MDLLIDNVLRHINLSSGEIDAFRQYWIIRDLKKDEYLLQNGEICRYDAFVLKGSLKAYFINPKSFKEEIVFFAIDDWWATDLDSFHLSIPSTLNIQAISDTKIAQITKDKFEDLLRNIPKLERYFRVILQSNSSALIKRIYLRNAFSAKDRYRKFLEQYPQINRQIPQYLVASYLGMSAEMLSKIRSDRTS